MLLLLVLTEFPLGISPGIPPESSLGISPTTSSLILPGFPLGISPEILSKNPTEFSLFLSIHMGIH